MESDSPAAVDLTRTEALLFDTLRSRPGAVWSRRELLEAMHGKTLGGVQEHAVDMMVARLRKSLGAAGACVETVHGRGYRFRPKRPACGLVPASVRRTVLVLALGVLLVAAGLVALRACRAVATSPVLTERPTVAPCDLNGPGEE